MRRKYFYLLCMLLFSLCLVQGEKKSWRSSLYPANWYPGYQDAKGRFLHDVSYAGYHNGEEALPEKLAYPIFNAVLDFGADNTGKSDATAAIQKTIDAAQAAGQGIVFLPQGLYTCDGLLTIRSSKIVLRGEGADKTRLDFTKVEGMSGKSHITMTGALKEGAHLLLQKDASPWDKEIYVESVGDLKVGDDVSIGWVISDAFIAEHGMTGTWKAFNGKWQPFFLRKVMQIDPVAGKIILDVPLRYAVKMRDQASARKQTGYIQECGIEKLAVGNAGDWEAAWKEKDGKAIGLNATKDCWVWEVHSFAPTSRCKKDFHLQSKGITVAASKRITVLGCRMENAQNRGEGGNGYLFEITRSNEILIQDCLASAGRHNFIQNWGFGTSGCVFLQCTSQKGWSFQSVNDKIGVPGLCEYHHSLAMACLVDACLLKDGWFGGNRRDWSTGAGHSVTQSIYWNIKGDGLGALLSWQYGYGYIIGTQNITVIKMLLGPAAEKTSPEDFLEGRKDAASLEPQSLYLDQLERRIERGELVWKTGNP